MKYKVVAKGVGAGAFAGPFDSHAAARAWAQQNLTQFVIERIL
jgi:hypothetical protein